MIELDSQLKTAIEARNLERVVQVLKEIKEFSDDELVISEKVSPGFTSACSLGFMEIIEVILEDPQIDVNVAVKGANGLIAAIEGRQNGVAKRLLDCEKIDLTANNSNAFEIACQRGYTDLIKMFLGSGRKLNLAPGLKSITKLKRMSSVHLSLETVKEVESLLESFQKDEEGTRKKIRIDLGLQESLSDKEYRILFLEAGLQGDLDSLLSHLANKRYLNFPIILKLNQRKHSQDEFQKVANLLQSKLNIRQLILKNCGLNSAGALCVIQALIFNLKTYNWNLKSIEIDDIELKTTSELEDLPSDVRRQKTKSIVQHILKLYQEQLSGPVNRTKFMMLGFQGTGKTSIIDCLYPITGRMQSQGSLRKTWYWWRLEGNVLRKYQEKNMGTIHKEYYFNPGEWKVEDIDSLQYVLTKIDSDIKINLTFENLKSKQLWVERLNRLILKPVTQGIEIQHKCFGDENYKLVDTLVWDGKATPEYLNVFHHFLSTQTVYFVLYKLDQKDPLDALEFWIKILTKFLPKSEADSTYSIFIVGTYKDQPIPINKQKDGENTLFEIKKLLKKWNISSVPFQYFEVSCTTFVGIEGLRKGISHALQHHTYLKEPNIPTSYHVLERVILGLREPLKSLPIITISELMDNARTNYNYNEDLEFTIKALNHIHKWGTCVYFSSPPELANLVVLNPEFLSKVPLATIFQPERLREKRYGGILSHSDLLLFCENYQAIYPLLERFEASFCLPSTKEGEEKEDFSELKSFVPSLLPIELSQNFQDKLAEFWPIDLPKGMKNIDRIFKFNVVPVRIAIKLRVLLHKSIRKEITWQKGALLELNFNETIVMAYLKVDPESNLLIISIRGNTTEHCSTFFLSINKLISTIAENYPHVVYQEGLPSPHFQESFISIDDLFSDSKIPESQRDLICPVTHFPINSHQVLVSCGLSDNLTQTPKEDNQLWWEWEEKDRTPDFVVYDNGPVHQAGFNKLKYILERLGIPLYKIQKVKAVNNPSLKFLFNTTRSQIRSKQTMTPGLFKKGDWAEINRKERQETLQELGDFISKFRNDCLNNSDTIPVIPVLREINEESVGNICNLGFSHDQEEEVGYGKGYYFTTSFTHVVNANSLKQNEAPLVEKYSIISKRTISSSSSVSLASGSILLLCVVIPGNPFPLTDKGENIACQAGYQSHYVGMRRDQSWISGGQLVIFQESQILPLFVLTLK